MKNIKKQFQIFAVKLLVMGMSFFACYGASARRLPALEETTKETQEVDLVHKLEMDPAKEEVRRPLQIQDEADSFGTVRINVGKEAEQEEKKNKMLESLSPRSAAETAAYEKEYLRSRPKASEIFPDDKPIEKPGPRARTVGGFRLSDVEAAEKGLKNFGSKSSTTRQQNVQTGLDLLKADRDNDAAAAEAERVANITKKAEEDAYYKKLELDRLWAPEEKRIKELYLADDKRLYNKDLFERAVEIFKLKYPEAERTDEVKKNANSLINKIQNDLRVADTEKFKQEAEEKAQRIATERAAEKAAAESPEALAKKIAEEKAQAEKAADVAKILDQKMSGVEKALAAISKKIKDKAVSLQTFYIKNEVKNREADLSTRISGQLLLTDKKNDTFGFTFLKESTAIKDELFARIPRGKEGERDEAAYLRADKNYSNAKDAIEKWSGEKMRYDRDIRALKLAGKNEEADVLRMKMDYEERERIKAIRAPLEVGLSSTKEEKPQKSVFDTD